MVCVRFPSEVGCVITAQTLAVFGDCGLCNAPAQLAVSDVCDECIRLDRNIARYQAFLPEAIDPLTAERVSAAIEEMTSRRATFHSDMRPACPKCGMNMVAVAKLPAGKRQFECLRCGHTETRKVEE